MNDNQQRIIISERSISEWIYLPTVVISEFLENVTYQGLYEEIGAFIGELISSGDEEVERLVQVEVVMAVEMTANKIVDLLLRHCV